jgi:two-component system chemotaxis sensor kinase CheA
MRQPEYEIDPTLLSEFVDEFEDTLSQIPSMLVSLEKEPTKIELIGAIFRPVHSLKGNAAYFDLLKIKSLAHDLESVLDKMRKNELVADKAVISTLLEGFDYLTGMLRRARQRKPEVEEPARFESLLGRVRRIAEAETAFDLLTVKRIVAGLRELRENAERDGTALPAEIAVLTDLARMPGAGARSSAVPQPATPSGNLIKQIRDLLNEPFQDKIPPDRCLRAAELLEQLKDLAGRHSPAKNALESLRADFDLVMKTAGIDALLRDALLESIDKVELCLGTADASPAMERLPDAAAAQKKTMRVAEENIDQFLEYVGELIVVREMFDHLQKRLVAESAAGDITDEFRRANDSFIELSHDLQTSIMAIRKLPMRTILQRVPRIVRDVSAGHGKEIEVRLSGEDIEVDKSLIESLESPIIHMVRNAADHGIELPDARARAGKQRKGIISVGVEELPDFVTLKIDDDGAGINLDAIRKKAESLGLVAVGAQMGQDDVLKLLFASGVSTAKKVTDISGRGVGMDIVRQNVVKLGGKISIDNRPGAGVTFSIVVPKNIGTQIINGFMVRVDTENFILPLENIVESFNAVEKDFTSVVGRGGCVMRRGAILPFMYLADIFGFQRPVLNGKGVTVVAIKHGDARFGLGIDEILGLQQIVLKPVSGLNQDNPLFAGAAITGSGRVAMIVDLERVAASGGRSAIG